jgi:hypothetical protein
MMKKIILSVFIVAIVTMGSTCRKNSPDCHVWYTIKNNSDNAIYFEWTRDSALALISYNPGSSPAEYKCDPKQRKNDTRNGCYETEILLSSTKKIYIFIFDAQIIETVPWETVKQSHMLLKRYDFTKEQLDSAKWIINYP